MQLVCAPSLCGGLLVYKVWERGGKSHACEARNSAYPVGCWVWPLPPPAWCKTVDVCSSILVPAAYVCGGAQGVCGCAAVDTALCLLKGVGGVQVRRYSAATRNTRTESLTGFC